MNCQYYIKYKMSSQSLEHRLNELSKDAQQLRKTKIHKTCQDVLGLYIYIYIYIFIMHTSY